MTKFMTELEEVLSISAISGDEFILLWYRKLLSASSMKETRHALLIL